MNNRPTTHLDVFEAALLTELKSAVSDAATAAPEGGPAPLGQPHLRQRKRWYIPIAAAAAAALAIALLVPGLGPTPAYAVSGRDNGEVSVRVTRLEGADGLEQALREHGIPADITYLPPGKKCASGRYTALDTPGLSLTIGADMFEVTIPPNAVGKDDTFVLSASVVPFPNGFRAAVDFDIAHGEVAPCQITNAP